MSGTSQVSIQIDRYREKHPGFPTNDHRKMLLWDLDGVVSNSMYVYGDTFSRVLNELGGVSRSVSNRFYMHNAGMELEKQFLYMAPKDYFTDDEREMFAKRCVDEFWNGLKKYKTPEPFQDFMDVSKRLGRYLNVIASGTRQDVLEHRLAKYGLDGFFKEVVGYSENMSKGKYLEQVGERVHRGDFDKVLTIGDGRFDMRRARELNFVGIGVIRDNGPTEKDMVDEGAEFTVRDLNDVEPIAKAI